MKVGKDSNIHPSVIIFGSDNIEIGDNVRIDAYCVLSGGTGLKIGNHIHIGAHSSLFAGAGIEMGDFCGLSPYVLMMSQSDDFSGESLVGPIIPNTYKTLKEGKIIMKPFSLIGSRSTILCGVTLHEGATIGAHSLVKSDCDAWSIYAGVPVKKVKNRSKTMIRISKKFLETYR